MPWQIPNYDSLHIQAAEEHDQIEDGWDDEIQLDQEELERTFPRG
jgi:hypothetical protein